MGSGVKRLMDSGVEVVDIGGRRRCFIALATPQSNQTNRIRNFPKSFVSMNFRIRSALFVSIEILVGSLPA